MDLLDDGFSRAFERAGFRGWTVPIGCSEPLVTLKIERWVCPLPIVLPFQCRAALAEAACPALMRCPPPIHTPACCCHVPPPPPHKLCRHANFQDTSRALLDNGVGYVRIYPSSAGSFDTIHQGVKASMPGAGKGAGASAGAGAAAGTTA